MESVTDVEQLAALMGKGGIDLEAALRGKGGAPGAMLAVKLAAACVRLDVLHAPVAAAAFKALHIHALADSDAGQAAVWPVLMALNTEAAVMPASSFAVASSGGASCFVCVCVACVHGWRWITRQSRSCVCA